MVSTGSLCPYRERKNLSESTKKTRTVESSREAASSLPLGLMRTHRTSSVIFKVLQAGRFGVRWRGGQGKAKFKGVRHRRQAGRTKRRQVPARVPAHRVWLMPSCLVPVSGSAATPHSQNLMSWSALPLTKPALLGSAARDHTGPPCALRQAAGRQDRAGQEGQHGCVAGKPARKAQRCCRPIAGSLAQFHSRDCNPEQPKQSSASLFHCLLPSYPASPDDSYSGGCGDVENLQGPFLGAHHGVAVARGKQGAQAVAAVDGAQAGTRPRVPQLRQQKGRAMRSAFACCSAWKQRPQLPHCHHPAI